MGTSANSSDLADDGPDTRRLTAVVYVDVVGYSRLIGIDDLGTIGRLRSVRQTVIDPAVLQNGGRVVQTGGDSLLMTFDSIAGAVRCAIKVQMDLRESGQSDRADRRIQLRIGVNIGDVIVEGTDLHGDSVNVAVRLQEVCPASGICVSRAVYEHVAGRFHLEFQPMGVLALKNIARPVEAYVLRLSTADHAQGRPAVAAIVAARPDRPSLAGCRSPI